MNEENKTHEDGEPIPPGYFEGARILAQSRIGPAEIFLLRKDGKDYLLSDPDTDDQASHRKALQVPEGKDPFDIFEQALGGLLAMSKGMYAMMLIAESVEGKVQ